VAERKNLKLEDFVDELRYAVANKMELTLDRKACLRLLRLLDDK